MANAPHQRYGDTLSYCTRVQYHGHILYLARTEDLGQFKGQVIDIVRSRRNEISPTV